MSQTIITKCDICQEEADHYPSWFHIAYEQSNVGVGNGLVKTTYINPKASYRGWARYEKFVDLCTKHRDQIIEAIQKVIEARS